MNHAAEHIRAVLIGAHPMRAVRGMEEHVRLVAEAVGDGKRHQRIDLRLQLSLGGQLAVHRIRVGDAGFTRYPAETAANATIAINMASRAFAGIRRNTSSTAADAAATRITASIFPRWETSGLLHLPSIFTSNGKLLHSNGDSTAKTSTIASQVAPTQAGRTKVSRNTCCANARGFADRTGLRFVGHRRRLAGGNEVGLCTTHSSPAGRPGHNTRR